MKASRPRRKAVQLDLFAEIDPPVQTGESERRQELHMAPHGFCGECLTNTGNPFDCTSTHAAPLSTAPD